MMSREAFIDRIIGDADKPVQPVTAPEQAPLPEGFEGFEPMVETPPEARPKATPSFARRLLEASDFGLATLVETKSLIRSQDAVVKFLPERAAYWPKTLERPFHTILFEADHTNRDLQAIPAFRGHAIEHLDLAEDVLARLSDEALQGFQKRGQSATAETLLGNANETLCVVSIINERESPPARLVCFATHNKATGGLETFHISEAVKTWERQLAHDHLGLLYERQFKKLGGPEWQQAFTTTDERKQAERLLEACASGSSSLGEILESVRKLLDAIALSFGLSRKPKAKWILDGFQLPADHDIGASPDAEGEGSNPFGGISLRDESRRLLGYLIYPLLGTADARRLAKFLSDNNRFHNVLVLYPQSGEATFELWQGRERLTGKLRKTANAPVESAAVINLLQRFFVVSKARIHKSVDLAQELAYRARYLRRVALAEIAREHELPPGGKRPVLELYKMFDEALARQSEPEFADAYAQTLTYGLLAARWMSRERSLPFTAENVERLLPSTSPFLVELFQRLVALRGDGRLRWLVEDLISLLQRIAVREVFPDDDHDPVIHFYEEFLDAYDPNIRAARGVYYTPDPIVNYIVRQAHQELKTVFGLRLGLADIAQWGEMAERVQHPSIAKSSAPFVQILDPATGTGTFLKHAIELIHDTMMVEWAGVDWKTRKNEALREYCEHWSQYVRERLLPRLYGFESMMAPYIVCHLRLGLLLEESGFSFGPGDRLHVFLSNSLEPGSVTQRSLLVDFVSKESQRASEVKERLPVTVVLMNPPYQRHSSNFGRWITDLIADYKREFPELSKPAQGKALADDYVKFIRLAEHYIERSGCGCVAFIANHRFLGNPTFRGMRRRLARSFSTISIVDLDGSARQRDPSSNEVDENVFNIQQGVAIGILTRASHVSDSPARVVVSALRGNRVDKFARLSSGEARFHEVHPAPPNYLFTGGGGSEGNQWDSFISLPALMSTYGDPAPGFVTTHDAFAISWSEAEAIGKVEALLASGSEEAARLRFQLCTTDQWSYSDAIRSLSADESWRGRVVKVLYRPFDWRFTVWDEHVNVHRRERASGHMLRGANLALVTVRQVTKGEFAHALVSRFPTELKLASHDRNSQLFPLWLYDDIGRERIPNFDRALAARFGIELTSESDAETLFHVVYALLYSPTYRQQYTSKLSAEFPAIPVVRKATLRVRLAQLGADLVASHLMESDYPSASWNCGLCKKPAPWKGADIRRRGGLGTLASGYPKHDGEKLRLNVSGWLEPITQEMWEFSIGGYPVLKKWLKSRPSPSLSVAEQEMLLHIVGIIANTLVLMKEIDEVIEEHGGWPGAFITSVEAKS